MGKKPSRIFALMIGAQEDMLAHTKNPDDTIRIIWYSRPVYFHNHWEKIKEIHANFDKDMEIIFIDINCYESLLNCLRNSQYKIQNLILQTDTLSPEQIEKIIFLCRKIHNMPDCYITLLTEEIYEENIIAKCIKGYMQQNIYLWEPNQPQLLCY